MSFEVVYNFYNKKDNSFDYDRDVSSQYKKIYGKLEEDYPLDKLASNIMQQMARRDIFVFDVEIFEFAKKKITFKQSKADLVIKNKKFSTKTCLYNGIESEEEASPTSSQPHQNQLPAEYDAYSQNVPSPTPQTNIVQTNIVQTNNMPAINIAPRVQVSNPTAPRKIVRMVVFDPANPNERAKFPYKFTPNKKYPVYRERIAPNGIGMSIETIDDLNNPVTVIDELFVTEDANLIGDNDVGFSTNKSGLRDDTLNWSGVIKDSVPKLR
jgi:hypothetical protein